MLQNRLRQIRLVVYALKRAYGAKIYFYRQASITQNVKTGVIDRVQTKYSVNKAIILPSKMTRDFTYDLSFIAANKNFTYGALFDPEQRTIIVDARDLASGFKPNLNDEVVYNNIKWLVKSCEKTAEIKAYVIVLKRVESMPNEIISSVSQSVTMSQTATGA